VPVSLNDILFSIYNSKNCGPSIKSLSDCVIQKRNKFNLFKITQSLNDLMLGAQFLRLQMESEISLSETGT